MNNLTIAGQALVAPPGTLPTGTLPDGDIIIAIERVDPENGYADDGSPIPSDHRMARCVYPDGSVKHHQVKDMADLLTKVTGQMRGRFGMDEVRFASVPGELTGGATIQIER